MTNNKLFLLLGTSLSFLPQTLNAQCVSPIQDCYALGYTQTSCPNGKGVKCPFGNGWYCGGTAAQDCIKLGYDKDCTGAGESGLGETCNGKYKTCTCDSSYKYTCTGTGYSGGSGAACDDKYQSCTCASGYEWKDGGCITTDPCLSSCGVGCLYYSDGSCSNNKVSGKILLGIVIMEKNSSANGWIISIYANRFKINWSSESVDIPELNNCTSKSCLTDTQASCTNTTTITNYGNSYKYPAAWDAKNYQYGGKNWCLPSGGLLNNALNNRTNLDKINEGISKAGGTKLGYGGQSSYGYERIWSSSEYSHEYAWAFEVGINGSFGSAFYLKYGINDNRYTVRPVLAFQILPINGQGANGVRFSAQIYLPLTDGSTSIVVALSLPQSIYR